MKCKQASINNTTINILFRWLSSPSEIFLDFVSATHLIAFCKCDPSDSALNTLFFIDLKCDALNVIFSTLFSGSTLSHSWTRT